MGWIGWDRYCPTGGILCELPRRRLYEVRLLLCRTTAAIGKGFAIGSAALTALSLTAAFLTKMGGKVDIDAANPYVLVGLLYC